MIQTAPNLVESTELELVIQQALERIQGRAIKDLCHYLPVESGGHIHHFTFKKLKMKSPQELVKLLQKYILQASRPQTVTPKQRARRNEVKKGGTPFLSHLQMERILLLARTSGDSELIAILSPKRSLEHVKKDLIRSIRKNKIEKERWDIYVSRLEEGQLTHSPK